MVVPSSKKKKKKKKVLLKTFYVLNGLHFKSGSLDNIYIINPRNVISYECGCVCFNPLTPPQTYRGITVCFSARHLITTEAHDNSHLRAFRMNFTVSYVVQTSCPEQLWGPPSLLSNGYQGLLTSI
jgi:hypothetical protein